MWLEEKKNVSQNYKNRCSPSRWFGGIFYLIELFLLHFILLWMVRWIKSAASRNYYYSNVSPSPRSIIITTKINKWTRCIALSVHEPEMKYQADRPEKKNERPAFLAILSCRFEIRQIVWVKCFLFTFFSCSWNCTSKQINWMYAIKTADIVLFGGCNQLNMTHTKALNSQPDKKARTHTHTCNATANNTHKTQQSKRQRERKEARIKNGTVG